MRRRGRMSLRKLGTLIAKPVQVTTPTIDTKPDETRRPTFLGKVRGLRSAALGATALENTPA